MKELFPGYYELSKDDFKKLWNEGIFVFDANVLLNLYRYSRETSDELLDLLDGYSSRLWLPYQAAYEFHKNRIKVIQDQAKAYKEIKVQLQAYLESFKQKTSSIISSDRHPFIKLEEILSKLASTIQEIQNGLDELEASHPHYLENDPILEKITELFNGKVGKPFAPEKMREILKEGKTRYEEKTPPGYEDQKKGGIDQYGDFVLWSQVIEYARDSKKPIIFVTDDRKEDWWLKVDGKTIGPRPELLNEIRIGATHLFYMYTADRFMEYALDTLVQRINKTARTAIEEIKGLRLYDEEWMKITNDTVSKLSEAFQSGYVASEILTMNKILQEASGSYLAQAGIDELQESLSKIFLKYGQPALRVSDFLDQEDAAKFNARALQEVINIKLKAQQFPNASDELLSRREIAEPSRKASALAHGLEGETDSRPEANEANGTDT